MPIMKGSLYGVGVGPGAPDLMTLRAVNTIKKADILCLPQPAKEQCRAYSIALQAVPEAGGKDCLCCDFSMTRDRKRLAEAHQGIYLSVRDNLLAGKNIAFLTIGDPSVYSTFSYISERASGDGFRVERGSGIPSFCASAAELGLPLCLGDEEVHIGTGQSDIAALLRLPGTKVIMKAGRRLQEIKTLLMEREREGSIKVYAAADCGLPEEKFFYSAADIPEDSGYMLVLIVKEQEIYQKSKKSP